MIILKVVLTNGTFDLHYNVETLCFYGKTLEISNKGSSKFFNYDISNIEEYYAISESCYKRDKTSDKCNVY